MPRATSQGQLEKRFELESCPGGFVILRKMTYGQFLHRRDIAARISVPADGKASNMPFELMQQKVSEYEFSVCVVDHNLEDDSGRKLNLSSTQDFNSLDPIIGQEIDSYINDMNQLAALGGKAEADLFPESEQA
jgi:hypothetical protein